MIGNYLAFSVLRNRITNDLSLEHTNRLVVLLFLTSFVVAALIDDTITISGPGVGLLEHPTTFSFLLLHLVILRVVVAGLSRLNRLSHNPNHCLKSSLSEKEKDSRLKQSQRLLLTKPSGWSAVLLGAFYAVGFCCFAWNSFQNQQPIHFLGFDFWDSIYHPAGYWITRIYKFYLFVLFLPAMAHAVFALIRMFWVLVGPSDRSGGLTLNPYHDDESGGCAALLDPLKIVLYPVVGVGVLSSLSALLIHRELDLTPLIGITVLSGGSLGLFLGYSWPLRQAIEKERRDLLSRIAQRQRLLCQRYLESAVPGDGDAGLLNFLDDLKARLLELPGWPQLRPVVKVLSIAAGSQYVVALIKTAIPILLELR